MPTLVYKYGCKAPMSSTAADVDRQLSEAHRYYNRLIELERQRIAERDEWMAATYPEVASAEQAVTDAESALADALAAAQRAKIVARSKIAPAPEREAIKAARAGRSEAFRIRKEVRRTVYDSEAFKARSAELYEAHGERRKALYAEYGGLFWGTKNQIVEAVEKAVQTAKGPPQFRHWSRDGRLTCQVIGGVSAADVYASADTRVQIERVEGHRKRAIVRIRIGSNPDRSPVWAEVMAYIHRPLPTDATVMSVSLVRREGTYHRMSDGVYRPRDEWSVQFTLRLPDQPKAEPRSGVVAVDVGWRRLGDGSLRVAYWLDDAGRCGELLIPADRLAYWTKVEELQSVRDMNFNGVRDMLADWLSLHPHPDELKERTSHLRQWRSINRLHSVVARWERFAGDGEIYATLTTWRDQDQHLHQWQVGNRMKASAWRQDLFRVFAARLARDYGSVAIEALDLREMRRSDPVESESVSRVVVDWRNAAANGELLAAIKAAGIKFGASVSQLDPAGTTRDCHRCGRSCEFDRANILHTCEYCGVTWDQDHNAAANLLRRHGECQCAGEIPAPARGPEDGAKKDVAVSGGEKAGRWQKRKSDRSKTASQAAVTQGV